MVLPVPLYQLQCGANSYDWGKIGHDSAAARFAAATEEANFTIQADKPYAELWMGTHPSNPSKDVATGQTLLEMVSENQALMTPEIGERYDKKLPFLFKVLSIQKALSIQAHPDKKLAERLHAQDPKNYPDDNHKPEMTIAITDFDGFCGFRPLAQIASFLKHVPELRIVVGQEKANQFISTVAGQETASDESTVEANKAALKDLFQALMTADEFHIVAASKNIIKSAENAPSDFGGSEYGGLELADLIVRLNKQFPRDIGLFCAFFLNYVKLKPGEAMFLQANDPHAYLSGEVIECMAASDNVVRAGFTPKYKDVKNLVQMLTYSYAPIEDQKMKPVPYKGGSNTSSGSPTSLLYDPPIEEFAVIRTELKSGQSETFGPIEGPSIVIVTDGNGTVSVGPKKKRANTGHVFFVGATATLKMDAEDGMVAFRAFCELK
ncbi:mannose-6-phosphate isomerase [Ascodesmis nigricans]|uniref:Mannose-6-phosphate isomerase n=1 Tax=Ascodesmis nigricans TaxID=341454 RepID=A0A4S2N1D4_9PEZI|nr:mannose-6-phosphate isomerase [Ascodesmis nigricans]